MRDLQTFKLKFDWVLTEASLRDILHNAGSFCLLVFKFILRNHPLRGIQHDVSAFTAVMGSDFFCVIGDQVFNVYLQALYCCYLRFINIIQLFLVLGKVALKHHRQLMATVNKGIRQRV
ncbi:Uncharacterised protein [Klebsiella pneumoniae]|nr:Uncharacterised protein [Klebsiella pneumoniae]